MALRQLLTGFNLAKTHGKHTHIGFIQLAQNIPQKALIGGFLSGCCTDLR